MVQKRSKQTPTSEWRESAYEATFRSNFLEAALGSLCDNINGIQTGPFGSSYHQRDYVPAGTPIITVEHLGDNRTTITSGQSQYVLGSMTKTGFQNTAHS